MSQQFGQNSFSSSLDNFHTSEFKVNRLNLCHNNTHFLFAINHQSNKKSVKIYNNILEWRGWINQFVIRPHVIQGMLLVVILIKRECILKGKVEFNTLHHYINTMGVFWDVWHFTGLPVSVKTCAYEIKGRLQRFQRHLTHIQLLICLWVHFPYYCFKKLKS